MNETLERTALKARMPNPAVVLPDAMKAIQDLNKVIYQGGVPASVFHLSHMRASQINGCAACVDFGLKHAQKSGESIERLFAVSAWRESPHFTDAERAALALTEAVTRLSDRSDAVPDEVWIEATKYYDEKALAALILSIATTNLFNRLNVTVRQPAGASW